MEKYKIKANNEQLRDLGIVYEVSGLVGNLKKKHPTGWYCIEVKHKIGDMEFTNDFDIPKTFLKAVE